MRLTPNQRMALFLKGKEALKGNEVLKSNQALDGSEALDSSEAIFDFNNWIRFFWDQLKKNGDLKKDGDCSTLPFLLTAAEQEIIFEKIIKDLEGTENLLKTGPLACLMVEAWNLRQEWCVSDSDIASNHASNIFSNVPSRKMGNYSGSMDNSGSKDLDIFQQTIEAYTALCDANGWIDQSSLLAYIMAIGSRTVGKIGTAETDVFKTEIQKFLPKKIECIGFLEWTPIQKKFLSWLENLGVSIQVTSLLDATMLHKPRVLLAANPEDELWLAVEYAKSWLQKHNTQNTVGTFAIVVPDLTQRRAQIERISAAHFKAGDYNISAPVPLIEYPLIAGGLLALELMLQGLKAEIHLEQISQFIMSPFYGSGNNIRNNVDEGNLSTLSALDVLLRENRETEYSPKRLLFLIDNLNKRLPEPGCKRLIEMLKNFFLLCQKFKSKRGTKGWRKLCFKALQTAGWLQGREFNETELQLKTQWDTLFEEYLKLDRVLGQHNFHEMLSQLHRLAKKILFLPVLSEENALSAPIQVLGILEAVGLPFDAMWIVGLHQGIWPGPANPNPFIPIRVQKVHNLPHSSPARELMIAKSITAEFQKTTDHLIFSYPASNGKEIFEKSPLLEDFEVVMREALGLRSEVSGFSKYVNAKFGATSTKSSNISAVKINAQEDKIPVPHTSTIPGGTLALKLQSACPFRAFAELRLKAKAIQKPSLGLNEAERGEIIHQIMQEFWKRLKTQAKMNALTEIELNDFLGEIISSVLDRWQEQNARALKPRYRTIEQKRLMQKIWQFIQLEKERAPFEVVAQEILQEVEAGGLRFKVRIDRVDRLATGEEILIDYKTGKVALSDWFGERPHDPQLPTYCVTRKEKPTALAFAIIRPETTRYAGLIDEGIDPTSIPGLKTAAKTKHYGSEENWQSQCSSWQSVVERLATEFSAGEASVDPREGSATCRTCALQTLCRVE